MHYNVRVEFFFYLHFFLNFPFQCVDQLLGRTGWFNPGSADVTKVLIPGG
jgi:hypothetical protein